MNDNYKKSVVRMTVQLLVGVVVAQAAKVGLALPEGALEDVFTPMVTLGVYAVLRYLEDHVPYFEQIAGVLLGGDKPDYQPKQDQ